MNNTPKRLRPLALTGCALFLAGTAALANPPFSSMADTVFDIIRTEDPSAFVCLKDEGRAIWEMWDRRVDAEFRHNAFHFTAHFTDTAPINITLNPEFETPRAARAEAMRYVHALGQLPPVLRAGIRQFGIHKGRESFHAGSGKIFMYQDQASLRIGQRKLEESIMHEAVHAALDNAWRKAPDWIAAQRADKAFVTRYAASRPDREDLAETMVFAYGLLVHPGRIPPVDSRDILAAASARMKVIKRILSDTSAATPQGEPPAGCSSTQS